MKELSMLECEEISGGGAIDTLKSVAKKVGLIALYDAVTDFAEGFVEGVKSEMPE